MHFQRQRSAVRSQTSEVSRPWFVARGPCFYFCFLLSQFLLLSGLSALFLVGGCSKSPDHQPSTLNPRPSPSTTPLAPDTVLRVHWAGKQTLGVAASSYSLMRLWNLPEGRRLERALLERFATAPGRLLTNNAAQNASAIFAPLIYDAINEESCLEIRQGAGRSEQMVFAIRLDDARAKDWHKGLADMLSATEGGYPSRRPGGWSLTSPRSQMVYELNRAGDWVIVGATKGTNSLFQEIVARIGREQVPFTTSASNHWVTVEADLNWVWDQCGMRNAERGNGASPRESEVGNQKSEVRELPRLSMVVSGDGANTITTGELTFTKPLRVNLEPWNFPKAQVQGPVVGFSAIRGIGPWLTESKTWSELKLGNAPNQIFTWADARAPMQMHLAAPSESATETTRALGETFATRANAWLADHALGSIARWPDTTGVVWKDLPMIAPYLTATNAGWLVGGISPSGLPEANIPIIYPRPSVDELLANILSRSNLVAYQWETTGSRAESMHVLGQLLRAITRHPQMPAGTGSSRWLEAARHRLGNCTTAVTLAAPDKLAFERKSSTGFSALELHLIADWMESPQFPRGFYSTLSPVGPALQPVGKQAGGRNQK